MRADLAAEIIAHNTGVLRARSAYQADQCFDEGICVRCQATFRDNGTSRECRACYRSTHTTPRAASRGKDARGAVDDGGFARASGDRACVRCQPDLEGER